MGLDIDTVVEHSVLVMIMMVVVVVVMVVVVAVAVVIAAARISMTKVRYMLCADSKSRE